MTNNEAPDHTYHVVLIGIDAYSLLDNRSQLHGCVSDIDSMQELLLDRVGIPPSQITRLVSPHPTPERHSTIAPRPATSANIREALTELGSEKVGPDDRVLIYYAGHGARPEIRRATPSLRGDFAQRREALVPEDGDMQGANVLFDFEFNALLAGIAGRTTSVTVVLDCCHSSGATRSLDGAASNTRFVDIGPVEISDDRASAMDSGADAMSAGLAAASVDACQVVAACLSHEYAHEVPKNISPGQTRSGLLTHSLTTALGQISDDEVASVSWGRLWNEVRANIETEPEANGRQHPWMSGGLAREWLGGPPNDGDVGLGIERDTSKPNAYVIRAGSTAGITSGARIAVYDAQPDKFPRLGSDEDRAARFSDVLLEVSETTPSRAMARAIGEPFDLPPGVRGRLIQAGEAELLACAVLPEDSDIVEALAASDLLEVTTDARALARLERQDDASWILTDDVHGADPGSPVLARLAAADAARGARDLLEHYVRYSGPSRMAKRCPDLPGALRLTLLACATERVEQSELPGLTPIPTELDGSYSLTSLDDKFCVRVQNASNEVLQVSLFISSADGTVARLDTTTIDPGASEYFWPHSEVGRAFQAWVESGRCIDRMVAIGTTDVASDLKHLEEASTFLPKATRGMTGPPSAPPVAPPPPADQWTAVEIILRTSAQHA